MNKEGDILSYIADKLPEGYSVSGPEHIQYRGRDIANIEIMSNRHVEGGLACHVFVPNENVEDHFGPLQPINKGSEIVVVWNAGMCMH